MSAFAFSVCSHKKAILSSQKSKVLLHSALMIRVNPKTSLRHFFALLIGVLCLSIMSQILGLPVSFANLEGSSDPIEASQLEGLSIVSSHLNMTPTLKCFFCFEGARWTYRLLYTRSFFRPPLSV